MSAWIPAIAAGSQIGGMVYDRLNRPNSDEEYNRQKEFAQMGIRWRVADAKAAGLHPLAALGGSGATYSPVSQIGDNFGERLGQNISRAVRAGQSKGERDADTYNELRLRHMRLQNQILEQSLERRGEPQSPSIEVADRVIAHEKGNPAVQAGTHPAYKYVWTGTGLMALPSDAAKEAVEDQPLEQIPYSMKKLWLHNTLQAQKPTHKLPAGWTWEFSRSNQEWQPRRLPPSQSLRDWERKHEFRKIPKLGGR